MRLRRLAWDLEKVGTEMCVAPALLHVAGPRTTIRPVAGLTLLHVDHPQLDGGKQLLKLAFDKTVALTAIILLTPLFAIVMLAIKLDDHGPVFFRQTRVGKGGHTFAVWKFRTMVADAEHRKAELAAYNEAAGALFKMRKDPCDQDGALAAPLLRGRAASAVQCAVRRHVPGWPAARTTGRDG